MTKGESRNAESRKQKWGQETTRPLTAGRWTASPRDDGPQDCGTTDSGTKGSGLGWGGLRIAGAGKMREHTGMSIAELLIQIDREKIAEFCRARGTGGV